MDLIIVDPGHGGDDPGAVNNELGISEKDINLAVSKKLWGLFYGPSQNASASQDALVRLTRTTDIFISLSGRTEYANHLHECFPESRALFVSLHCNAFSDRGVRGVEVFHHPDSDKGGKLARSILEALNRGLPGIPSRGLKTNPELAVLRKTLMPAVLVEMEFISHPDAARLLASESFQWKTAQCIVEGISSYLLS